MTNWKKDRFLIATAEGPEWISGWSYRGLGVDLRKPGEWFVTHLGSGHRVCGITGTKFMALQIASEIAECGDWDFDGLAGHLNRDPEIATNAAVACLKYPDIVTFKSGGRSGKPFQGHEAVARTIAEMRA